MPTCPFCVKEVPALSSVCPHCLRALPLSVTTAQATQRPAGVSFGWLRPLLLLLVAGVAGGYAYRHHHREPAAEPAPEVVAVPATTTIAPPVEVPIADTASVAIAAGGHLAYTFSGGGRSGCRIHGTVQALAGGDRRIDLSVVDRDGLADMEAGKAPRTYYASGPVTDVQLDINLDGRTEYTLVVANAAGSRRPKTVRLRQVIASCAD